LIALQLAFALEEISEFPINDKSPNNLISNNNVSPPTSPALPIQPIKDKYHISIHKESKNKNNMKNTNKNASPTNNERRGQMRVELQVKPQDPCHITLLEMIKVVHVVCLFYMYFSNIFIFHL
jgi:hypothetical protein